MNSKSVGIFFAAGIFSLLAAGLWAIVATSITPDFSTQTTTLSTLSIYMFPLGVTVIAGFLVFIALSVFPKFQKLERLKKALPTVVQAVFIVYAANIGLLYSTNTYTKAAPPRPAIVCSFSYSYPNT